VTTKTAVSSKGRQTDVSSEAGTSATHSFPVHVVDGRGHPVLDARVCVVSRGSLWDEAHPYTTLKPTHIHRDGGNYLEMDTITPTAGDWLLVVNAPGKAPVVQPLLLKPNAKGEYVAKPTPARVATLDTLTVLRKVGPRAERAIGFQVTLYPATELVYLAGLDYHHPDVSEGWTFHRYGFGRAEALRREGKIHPGTIVTVFSTAKIWRTTRVWGTRGWVDIEVLQLGDPSRRKSRPPGHAYHAYRPTHSVDLHVSAFYKHLAEVGKRAPQSVLDLGIFSHSWPRGPILYNTRERPAYIDKPERDPDDFDARVKDFHPKNFSEWETMKDSISSGARFTIWGCSATTIYKYCSQKSLEILNRGGASEEFFTVRDDGIDDGVRSFTEVRTSESRHRSLMDRQFHRDTYSAAAAACLGIEVRGGCPGTGSEPIVVDGIDVMTINVRTYHRLYEYFRLTFGKAFKASHSRWDTGYVDYSALQKSPPVPVPPFSPMEYWLEVDFQPPPAGELDYKASAMSFGNGLEYEHPAPILRVQSWPHDRIDGATTSGVLYELTEKAPAGPSYLFVQNDGRIFVATRNTGDRFTARSEVR